MSHSRNYLQEVGNFFGINKASSEQWKRVAEKQIEDGEFGLRMRQSIHGHAHNSGSKRFLHGAEKILSKIDAFQKIEEGKQVEREVNVESNTAEKTVSDYPLSLTSRSETQSLSKQSVFNATYVDNDDHVELNSQPQKMAQSESRKTVHFMKEEDYPITSNDVRASKQDVLNDVDHDFLSKRSSTTQPEEDLVTNEPELTETSQPSESKSPWAKVKLIFFDELFKLNQTTDEGSNIDKVDKTTEKSTVSESQSYEQTVDTDTVNPSKSDDEDKSKVNDEVEPEETNAPPDDNSDTVADTVSDTNVDDTNVAETNIDDKKTKEPMGRTINPNDLAYGKEALEQYYVYKKYEKREDLSRVQWEYRKIMKEYDWKLKAVDDLISMARDFYMNPDSNNAAKWRELKTNVRRNSVHVTRTEVRRKLGTLPEYKPFFTWFIITVQLIAFIVTSILNGFTYIGLEPKLTLESGIQTFIGLETIDKWTPPNVWIGPSDKDLIGCGAVFAPCMRQDMKIQLEYSRQNYSTVETLGCCEIASRNVAGTTTQTECESLTEGVGTWRSGVMCSERSADESSVRHTMKPCCVGLKGQCRLLSHKHCIFLSGEYHQFGYDHCSQVNCLQGTCKLGNLEAGKTQPWQPDNPHQWWRLPLSLFYHHGIIHILIVSVVQWFLFIPIERTAGWLRMIVVYFLTGSAALLMSAIFSPYQSHVGGVGAICGMIGLIIVELVQFWSLVKQPLIELGKLSIVIILLLFAGTLPYLDIFGMIVGLFSGVLCGVLFLPYVTFGKWHAHIRVILVLMSLTLLFVTYFILVHVFVNVQTVENCKICRLLNCLPYTEKMCETSYWEQF
ncbi:hypothetical protein ACF0H5_009916 [Mactra antiquata]